MRIRSITSFYDPRSQQADLDLKNLASLSEKFRKMVTTQFMPVLSTRLATIPFPYYLAGLTGEESRKRVIALEQAAHGLGWEYLSLGPALTDQPWSYPLIPQLLGVAEDIFCGAVISDEHYLYPSAVRASAKVIHDTATISPDGFANLRFAALANVDPGTPFLPAAYHQVGSPPSISLAVECADVILEAFDGSQDLEESRNRLLSQLEKTARDLSLVFESLAECTGIQFLGFDFSPAPFPEDWCSLGGAVEKLGLEHIGGIGSLGAVAIIADTLDRGNWQRAGFNGMMLPVLEDSILARRAEQNLLSVQDLLLYSTVCGTGLDTIPLSGETTVQQLECVLMDIGAMAVRLGKPLTARLMPLPGKVAGDRTGFDFAYFANSRVLSLDGQKLSAPINGDSPISLVPRGKHLH
jgi:hypothetical protein